MQKWEYKLIDTQSAIDSLCTQRRNTTLPSFNYREGSRKRSD